MFGNGDTLALNLLPHEVRDFIWEIINFRKSLSLEDSTQKSPEGISDSNLTA